MELYEINNSTLAIISMGRKSSKVLEEDGSKIIANSSFAILDHSCRYFGSSYAGRKEGSVSIIGNSYKIPIVVEESQDLVFFPTTSPDDEDCIWLAINKIKAYKKRKYSTTSVIFDNDTIINIPLSFGSFQNQIFRASRLCYLINVRKKDFKF